MMYSIVFALVSCISAVLARGGPATENYKDQYCTDPRTMKKHAAYTEWADAYSCTRHRCQPGGRNLAIYTVGCKRVEAPESAIECEEVVEDTNMQFPYCCTRLRCLVVVRGEVWTRVLGQPWETLPAAPWSHMYKMKKPPPADSSFLPKNIAEGPVYELAQEPPSDDKNRRSKKIDESSRVSEIRPRTATERSGSPDIVIALSTGNDKDNGKENEKDFLSQTSNKLKLRRKHVKPKTPAYTPADRSEADEDTTTIDEVTEKDVDASDDLTRPDLKTSKKKSWTPESMSRQQWPENDVMVETENAAKETLDNMPDFRADDKAKPTNNLQDLVDAIGTRMRDIENVVQKMSEKVRKPEKETEDYSSEITKRSQPDDIQSTVTATAAKKTKSDNYKRLNKGHGSKYLHNNQDLAPEKSSFPDDAVNLNGYFSDASNTVRKGIGSTSKDSPAAAIYMAPVDNRRVIGTPDGTDLEDADKKHKKHHKKKKSHHKKRHSSVGTSNSILKEEKRTKSFNKLNSLEMQLASLEDSSLII